MTKKFWQRLRSAILSGLAFTQPLCAEEISRVYTIRQNNVFVGKLSFQHEISDGQYNVSLEAETIGFAKAMFLASFEGEAKGEAGKYRQYFPQEVLMDVRMPQYQNQTSLAFADGYLIAYADDTGKPPLTDFSQHQDAVDPVTAFAYLARPTAADKLCELRVEVIDGQHVFRLVLREPERRSDGRFQCKGALERVEGFTDQELSERSFYGFTAVYRRETENEYRLDWVVTDSPLGTLDLAFHY